MKIWNHGSKISGSQVTGSRAPRSGPEFGTRMNRTAITGPKLLQKRDQETETQTQTEMEIEPELAMGPESWDRKSEPGHGTGVTEPVSRAPSHGTGVTESE